MRDLFKISKLRDLSKLTNFQKFCFDKADAKSYEDFSNNVILRQKKDSSYTAYLQDEIINSPEFMEITNDKEIYNLASHLMEVPVSDVKIVFPHFRADLPQDFADQEKKMSLPWHQEGGYYLAKGNCTPDSIVMSISLHDCDFENGALNIAGYSEKNIVTHENYFMDKNHKKHFRVECNEPDEIIIAETKFGEVVSFDFKRPHQSGTNISNLVRLTLLIRATSYKELALYEMN